MAAELTYTKDIAIEICAEVSSSNKSMAKIAREMGLTVRTIWRWIANYPDFREMYDLAKEQQADYFVEEMVEIADTASKDLIDAQDRKLRVNVRQWAASKFKPKKYGENRSMQVDVNMRRSVSAEQMDELRQGLLKEIAAPKEDFEDAEEVD